MIQNFNHRLICHHRITQFSMITVGFYFTGCFFIRHVGPWQRARGKMNENVKKRPQVVVWAHLNTIVCIP